MIIRSCKFLAPLRLFFVHPKIQMDPSASFNYLLFISTFVLSTQPFLSTATDSVCSSWSCSPTGPLIQFPFWLRGEQPDACGFPGFELWCNNKSQTILSLPWSGDFVVRRINYYTQSIFINDPAACLPNRIPSFNLTDTPFADGYIGRYKFVNCSSNWTDDNTGGDLMYHPLPIFCLSGKNHTVYALNSLIYDRQVPSYCHHINSSDSGSWSVSGYWSSMTSRGDLLLSWSDPRCLPCTAQGLPCGVADEDEIGCVIPSRHGLPKSAKYGIIIGAAIPASLIILWLMGYACGRGRMNGLSRGLDTEPSATIAPQPVVIVAGLDGRIIESLPKTVIGESGRLPKPNDATCPICLCEYQPKETLRTIPECNHYFHAICIDEWLKLNGTCPLCRNSPESLSVTPCSSMSSSVSSTSS